MGLPGVYGDGQFNGTVQNVVWPTLVAMAMKFGLGAGIQSPTGLAECVCVNFCVLSSPWRCVRWVFSGNILTLNIDLDLSRLIVKFATDAEQLCQTA